MKSKLFVVGCQLLKNFATPHVLYIYLDRIYKIIRINFGLIFLYPVHPVDPVRKK